MSFSKKEREQYNKSRDWSAKELGLSKNEYNKLRRASQSLSKHDTDLANGTVDGEPRYRGNKLLNEYTEKAYTKDVGKSFAKARMLLKMKKLHAYHQSDPRGVSLHLGKEKLGHDNYTSKGRPIY